MRAGSARPGALRHPAHGARGYAYLMLLVAVASIATLAGYSVELGSTMSRRDAERELLHVGEAFERAIVAYARGGPTAGGLSRGGPRSLDDLLRDPRQPGVVRHLRKPYRDPLTGGTEWGLLRDATGGILGVYSLAPGQPIRQANFPLHQKHLAEASSYADWVFGLPDAHVLAQGVRPANAIPGPHPEADGRPSPTPPSATPSSLP